MNHKLVRHDTKHQRNLTVKKTLLCPDSELLFHFSLITLTFLSAFIFNLLEAKEGEELK